MGENPKISVIMPAYNVGCWIEESIKSLLSQTYDNFELIIIDDGSTDETHEITTLAAKSDSRIKLLRLQKNKGIVTALNAGLRAAKGEYIARMDADDLAEKNRLELQLRYLIENPDLALVGSQMISIDESGNRHGVSPCPVTYEEAKLVLPYSSPVPHIWMCKSEIYVKLGGYRNLAPAEDYDFLLRLDTLDLKYGNHPEPLMMIRSRDGNTASTASLRQRKAHNYVFSLYRQRCRKGTNDSFCEHAFKKLMKSNQITDWLHGHSSKFLARSIKSSNPVSRAKNLCFSFILSRHNAQYIYRRLIYRYKLRAFKK